VKVTVRVRSSVRVRKMECDGLDEGEEEKARVRMRGLGKIEVEWQQCYISYEA
jgi:hypothetical protein